MLFEFGCVSMCAVADTCPWRKVPSVTVHLMLARRLHLSARQRFQPRGQDRVPPELPGPPSAGRPCSVAQLPPFLLPQAVRFASEKHALGGVPEPQATAGQRGTGSPAKRCHRLPVRSPDLNSIASAKARADKPLASRLATWRNLAEEMAGASAGDKCPRSSSVQAGSSDKKDWANNSKRPVL